MSPSHPGLDAPLSEVEQQKLEAFLDGLSNPAALDYEALDGFLCALMIGPEMVLPSEYLPVIWGGELSDADAFGSQAQAQEIMTLILRHQNAIAQAFAQEGVHLPLLADEPAPPERIGERWARGFMRAVDLRRDSWKDLLLDENEAGSLIPIALLAGEIDPDWLERPSTREEQDQHLLSMLSGAVRIYRYYLRARRDEARAAREESTVRRSAPKVGRNEPCPCGSGKKFKNCCGGARSLH